MIRIGKEGTKHRSFSLGAKDILDYQYNGLFA
jgi:hypothetical protein